MYYLSKTVAKISSLALCASLLGMVYTLPAFGMNGDEDRDWRAYGFTTGPQEMSMADIQAAIDAMEGGAPQRHISTPQVGFRDHAYGHGDDDDLGNVLAMIAAAEGVTPPAAQRHAIAQPAYQASALAVGDDDEAVARAGRKYAKDYSASTIEENILSATTRIEKVYNGHKLSTESVADGFTQEVLPLVMKLQTAAQLEDQDLGPRILRIAALEGQLTDQQSLLDTLENDRDRSIIQARITELRTGIESIQHSMYGRSAEQADASRTFLHTNAMHLPAALRRLMHEITLVGAPEAILLTVKRNIPGLERETFEALWQIAEALPHSARSHKIRTVLPDWEE